MGALWGGADLFRPGTIHSGGLKVQLMLQIVLPGSGYSRSLTKQRARFGDRAGQKATSQP